MLFYSATEDWKKKDDVIFRKIELEILMLGETSYFRKDQRDRLSFLCGQRSWKQRRGLVRCGGGRGERKFIWEDDGVVNAFKRLERHMQSFHRETVFSALNICASTWKGISCKCFLRTWMFAFASFLARGKRSFSFLQREESICVPTCHVTWL